MPRSTRQVCWSVAALALAAGAWALSNIHQAAAPPAVDLRPAKEEHYVTPAQLLRAGAATDRRVATERLRHAAGDQLPLVVVFLKDGCPCNLDFEPFFHRAAAAYGGAAQFVAVIDADDAAARAYAAANRVPYPVVADPRREIIRGLQAEHGGYVALLRTDDTVHALWPGVSADMMRELGSQIAGLAKVDERSIDIEGMPRVLMTGCPYVQ